MAATRTTAPPKETTRKGTEPRFLVASTGLLLLAWTWLGPTPGWAQSSPTDEAPDVAGSGISQGSGAITTRSDVNLSVENLPGTSSLRLNAIGQAIGSQMGDIRQCYADVTSERPITTGDMRLSVRIDRQQSAAIAVAHDGINDAPLRQCILRALRRASFNEVRGPAGGMVVVQFNNTAAQGAALVARERSQRRDSVVEMVDGQPQARSTTARGEVTILLRGLGNTSAEAVNAMYRSVQARIGSLLDCRRRAGRRGMDPSGDIVLSLQVPPRGTPSGRNISSTVTAQRAPSCVMRSLSNAGRGAPREAAGWYHVEVHFAGAGTE